MRGLLNIWMRRRLQQLGVPGVTGIGVLMMSLALYFSTVQPMQQQLDEVRQSASRLHDRIEHSGRVLRASERPTAEQLDEFYRIFPNEKDTVDVIGKIIAIAQGDGLNLDQGEYKVNREKVGKLTRLQMILPVKGEYQQIRKFLADMGNDIPVVSLEQVQFQRQKVGDPSVDADIRLAIYLGRS